MLTMLAALLISAACLTSVAAAQLTTDPRVGLAPGLDNPGVAEEAMTLLELSIIPNPKKPADPDARATFMELLNRRFERGQGLFKLFLRHNFNP